MNRPWVTTLAEGLQPTSGSPLEEHYRRRHGELRDAGRFCRLVQEGGMGAVLEVLAGDERNPWRLALKLLKRRWLDQASAVDRFRRELASHRRLSETLQATRLVPCFAFHDNDDPAHIFGLFPYYPEGSLQQKLREGIAMDEALFVLADAVEGLQSLHGHRYLHRDFHPHNVLLEREGGRLRGVLGDLGVGMFLEPNTIFSAEQLRHDRDHRAGHPGFIDPWSVASRQADLYSVGVTLYRVLAGHLPPEAGTREGLRLPEEVAHGIDPAVRELGDEVLLRLSSADGKERYGSAREARQDLVALAERVLEAGSVSRGARPGTVRRRVGYPRSQTPSLSAPRTAEPSKPNTAPRSAPSSSRTLPAPGRRRLALVGIALGLALGLPVAWWLAPHLAAARLEAGELFSASAQVVKGEAPEEMLQEMPQEVPGRTPQEVDETELAMEPPRAQTEPTRSESETESLRPVKTSPAPPEPPVVPVDPEQVEAAWKQRDLQALRQLGREHPGDPLVASRLGLLLSRQGPGELAEAARLLETAIARDPRRGELRLVLGRILLQQGHPAAARQLLRGAPGASTHRGDIQTLLVTLDVDSDLQPRTDEETRR